ncbi:MAG: hypothetical protein JXB10_00630 [Pirellulales bacterium]|nr:hypothetical protein [Pirellulales bacterium]
MCQGIALSIDELPEELLRAQRHRVILREPGVSREVRFLYRDPRPELPVWHDARLMIYAWGNFQANPKPQEDRHSCLSQPDRNVWPPGNRLPRTGWCRQEDVEAGIWQPLRPVPVEIPATLGWEKGVWFLVPEGGLRGVLVRDAGGRPHVYLLTQPASHYYQIMTRSPRMPVFLGRQM